MLIRQIFIEDGKVFGVADNDRKFILVNGEWQPYGWEPKSYEVGKPVVRVGKNTVHTKCV